MSGLDKVRGGVFISLSWLNGLRVDRSDFQINSEEFECILVLND